ncbi:MAG: leucine-rich repeat protein [Alphaproteobacteria bacterium]|nr:leucine-rich repeat protein [Alphaproteobacteria bacterium]
MKRILSILFMCLFVVLSPTRASAACTSSQIDVLGDGTQCETSKFELTTTSLAANTTFTFTLGASGTFYVDWGDGGAVETIARDSVTATDYTHTYTTAGVYTIRFSGLATEYDVSSNGSTTISFYKASGGSQGKIASISGNLASIFPYLGSENNQAPRFYGTFRGATNLTSIPATLFSGITTGEGGMYMFGMTFYGCTGLTSIPATLFSGITTGANSMFSNTFSGCTGLTSLPEGLFSSITTGGYQMFSSTFSGCTGLTRIPARLFSGLTTVGGYMFQFLFNGCKNLAGVIPPDTFAGLTANGAPTNTYIWTSAFTNTKLATSCPAGTHQHYTGYESKSTGLFEDRVSCACDDGTWGDGNTCTACANTHPAHSSYYGLATTATCPWACDAGYYWDGTACSVCSNSAPANSTFTPGSTTATCPWTCNAGYITNGNSCDAPAFSVTTTSLPFGDKFTFSLSAVGTFYVNWGDGTEETIVRDNTTSTWYTHTYTTPGVHTINFGGTATAYNTSTSVATILFYKSSDGSQKKIASISGNLATIFPSYGTDSGQSPRFNRTFREATNLTSVPATLFSGFTQGTNYMFSETFYGCTGLTSLPAGLFSSFTTGATYMFSGTFYGCKGLTSLPTGLFGNITTTTGATYMFNNTFYGCTGLTSLPTGLFSGMTSGTGYMFYNTFKGCTGLTSLPAGLFSSFTTGANYMFSSTFEGCTGLTSLPADLFSGMTTGAQSLFSSTFKGCTGLTSLPDGLFSSITTGAQYMFLSTFNGCTGLTKLPSRLFSGLTTTGSYMFSNTFNGCTNLGGYIPPDTFAGLIENGSPSASMWNSTFTNTQLLTECPTGTEQYITRYEGSTDGTTWNGKVSCGCEAGYWVDGATCTACSNTIPAHSSYTTGATNATCPWVCDSDYVSNGTSCVAPAFSVTTTSLNANDTFTFSLTAVGTFYVNWGDGTQQTIVRTDTTSTWYTHTYSSAGTYTINFGGIATSYYHAGYQAAISFYKSSGGSQDKIASVSGNLATIFPYLGSDASQRPKFYQTFRGATNLTSISAGLFSGFTIGGGQMFHETFYGCTGLTSIPAGLFSSITTAAGTSQMFSSTFYGCTGLTTVPADLFGGITTGADHLFYETFRGCTGLTSIPAGLFNKVTSSADATYMFYNTFYGCTGLTSLPTGLFNSVTTGAEYLFHGTFRGCTGLTSIPAGLFSSVTTGANYMFMNTFYGCTGLTSFPAGLFSGLTTAGNYMFAYVFQGCTNLAGFIPPDAFAGLIANNSPNTTYMWRDAFYNTQLLTQCPVGYTQYITGYEGSSYTSAWYNRVSCQPCPAGTYKDVAGNEACSACGVGTYMSGTGATECDACTNGPANSTYTSGGGSTNTCEWSCDSGTIPTGTSCDIPKFEVTTTELDAGTTFTFTLSAQGTFYVDWGDGSAVQTITRSDTTATDYSHTYETAGSYTIKFSSSGITAYNEDTTTAAISFYKSSGGSQGKIASLSGSLGALFPTLASSSGGRYARFINTFRGATNLTSLPSTLFSGVASSGTYLFYGTFYGCTGLTSNGIPSTLFSSVTTGGTRTFYETFRGCTGLTTIPSGLFSTVTTNSNSSYLYVGTFRGCTGLTEIPSGLFSRVTTTSTYMFQNTFYGCTGLTTIPSGLFSNINAGGATYLFNGTFYGCTGLTSIPEGLFSRITAGKDYMFSETFRGCTNLTALPSGLFSNITTTTSAQYLFDNTFLGCSKLATVPANTFSGITSASAEGVFRGTFQSCTSLTSIDAGLFSGITSAVLRTFNATFQGAGLTSIPDGLFSGITAGAHSMFYSTFQECTSLTALPPNLFANITSGVGNSTFRSTFYGCSNLRGYVPPTFFAGLIANNSPYTGPNGMATLFQGTSLATSCPAGTTQYITGYESYWTSKVSCQPCPAGTYKSGSGNGACSACGVGTYMADTGATACTACTNTIPENAVYSTNGGDGGTTNTCEWSCDSGTIPTGTSCEMPKFSVTTTSMAANTAFSFSLSATGTFYIDCGDGGTLRQFSPSSTISNKTITRDSALPSKYSCTWSSAGVHTVRFGGVATGYAGGATSNPYAPISFFYDSSTGRNFIVSVDGSLGALFPQLGTEDGKYPKFNGTFQSAPNLTTIPGTLFSGLTGGDYMFSHMFSGCSSLTTIPDNLFSGITTSGKSMFNGTFSHTGITSIPSGLFDGDDLTTGAYGMFWSVFSGCSSLTTILAGLFSNFTTGGYGMFQGAFSDCTSLTTIPGDLFSGITTGEPAMFYVTFSGCTGLTEIPENLFANITTISAINAPVFWETFSDCTNLTGFIPPTLFAGLIANGSPNPYPGTMRDPFFNTGTLTECPAGYTQYITGYEDDWGGKVSCELCPAGTYKDTVGNQACSACPAGTYIGTTGATACTACPALDTGYAYADGTGWTGWNQCSEQMRPTNCYSGYLTKTASSASAWGTAVSTLSAEPGYEVTGSGDNTVCSECGVGRYGPGGTTACSSCPTGLTTVGYGSGADEAGDCGRILHVSNGVLYLRSVKKTTPSLNVRIGNDVFYGNMSTEQMNMSGSCEDNPELKVNNGGTIYWIHDDSSHFCGVPM